MSDIVLAVTERQIAAGETACFPFAARTAYGIPSIHEFSVTSDNPNFDPEWVRLRRPAGDSYGPHYTLEISPGAVGRAIDTVWERSEQRLQLSRSVLVRRGKSGHIFDRS